ncbi:endo-1,4-beta-xylanase [Parabacteroides sp. PFB2-10]|uniref:endo-1,4-beta-xylanase n=1 Tax=Parabacteroides sp. PFB2-10 TaxID=1742405 RepID=UPI002474E23B|nr:endo-1,4-beta-xylanase [Parabacteroides sp. PFB2-10]MDH6312107.1 endo-1,4-beta-xylanase [Parabacteroides sp. PFB2-10]MDL2244552.1 endo-1,4-beta-xylanase [Parabacteroides sp. OttesenSCG-928-J18]
MKHTKYILGAFVLASMAITSCVDDSALEYDVEKPASITQMEYLNDYDALKSYVNRSTDPNFKLGSGVTVSEYVKEGLVYRMSNSNFDELTAGNAMKYSSIVKNDGSMDFSKVIGFVQAAKAGGATIYGHTLAWHAQQNNKYLNSLLADKEIEVDPDDADPALRMVVPTKGSNPWDSEIYYDPAAPLVVGQEYTISMRIKATNATNVNFWPGVKGGATQYLPGFAAGEQWAEASVTFTANYALDRLRFCFGTFEGELFFDDLSLKATGSDENLIANPSFDEESLTGWSKPGWHSYTFGIVAVAPGPSTYWVNLVSNSNCEGNDVSCFFATEKKDGPKAASFGAAGTGADGVGRAIVIESGDDPTNAWDTQFFVKVPHTFEEGEAYNFSMKIKASKPATITSQAHNNPGGYLHYAMVGSPQVTTEWQEYKNSGVISGSQKGMNTIAFNLSESKVATTYYFDDIVFEKQESGNTIPLTDEEKAEALTGAMDRWIAGMMTACDGYVTAWDVVNEALSGSDGDGDGKYDLQSASNGDPAANFYWQDYLGDNDYVRTTVKLARQHFAESGGNPSDLKLFINDYNLESWWDGNGKAKSLVKWIEQWESDGVTKIDGIGTQMHVSYILDAAAQKSQEESIVNMFKLLAATGKLIKITELDMGITEKAFAAGIKTEDMTEEHHKAMAGFYTFIIQKYFELVPAAQRYGITQWAVTDSPTSSSWRGGEPIGLWDLNNNRKHTYAGFAAGLSGQ